MWWQRLEKGPGTHFCSQRVTGGVREGRRVRGWESCWADRPLAMRETAFADALC